jgi:hypothetical protein
MQTVVGEHGQGEGHQKDGGETLPYGFLHSHHADDQNQDGNEGFAHGEGNFKWAILNDRSRHKAKGHI